MEVTIKIDKRSKQAKVFYEYLKTLPFVELEEPRYNKDTEKAIKEVKSLTHSHRASFNLLSK